MSRLDPGDPEGDAAFENGEAPDPDAVPEVEGLLVERLRKLQWPTAPPEVKRQGLEKLLRQFEEQFGAERKSR